MKRLQDLLSDIFGEGEPLPEESAPLREHESWDSLKHVQLVVGLERTFGVSLSEEDIRAMSTTADIVRVLAAKGVHD